MFTVLSVATMMMMGCHIYEENEENWYDTQRGGAFSLKKKARIFQSFQLKEQFEIQLRAEIIS